MYAVCVKGDVVRYVKRAVVTVAAGTARAERSLPQ
jgi:hypothetical protein